MSDQIKSEQNTKHRKMFYVCEKKTKVAKKILRNLILKQNQRADLRKPLRVSLETCKFCFLCGHLYQEPGINDLDITIELKKLHLKCLIIKF